MMLKMVRMVMLGFSGRVGGGDAGRKQSEPSAEGQNFRGLFMEGGVCSPETWISVFSLPEGRSGWGLQGKFGVSLAASAPRPTPGPLALLVDEARAYFFSVDFFVASVCSIWDHTRGRESPTA